MEWNYNLDLAPLGTLIELKCEYMMFIFDIVGTLGFSNDKLYIDKIPIAEGDDAGDWERAEMAFRSRVIAWKNI